MENPNIKYLEESLDKLNSANKLVTEFMKNISEVSDVNLDSLSEKLKRKKIKGSIIEEIVRADYSPTLLKSGLSKFYKNIDRVELMSAETFYNVELNSDFKRKLNSILPMGTGRGDVILSSMIKNAVSGGTESGDIILIGGKIIDVKELDSSGEVKIPFSSIRVEATKFADSMSEMTEFFRKYGDKFDPIIKGIFDRGLKPSGRETRDTFTFKLKSVFGKELSAGFFQTLYKLIEYIEENYNDIKVDSVKFVIDGEKTTMAINNPEEIKHKIESGEKILDLDVTKLSDDDKFLIAKFRSLNISKNYKALLGLDMTKAILENVKYQGIFILQKGGDTCKYYDRSQYLKILKFNRITQGAFKFKII